MAKKVKPSPENEAAPSRSPSKSAQRLRPAVAFFLVSIAVVVLSAGAAFIAHHYRELSRLDVALPLLPMLSEKPLELQRVFQTAQARVLSERASPSSVKDLAQLYHANDFRPEAESCWKILQTAQPLEARWPYYLADLRRMGGDVVGLSDRLEEVLKLAPDYAPAWLQWADLQFKIGQLEVAERAYKQRLSLIAGDAYALFGLARVTMQRGQKEEGKRQIVELIRLVPDFPSSHNLYAEILAAAGEDERAAEQRRLGSTAGRFRAADDPWLKELQASCFDAERLIEWGETSLQTKQGDLGKAHFDRALQLAPNNPRCYERLGAYYLNINTPAKAVEILERGAKLPDVPERLFGNLCDAYNALQDPAGELRAAEAGIRLWPKASILHNGRGHALVGLKRLEEALEEYQIAIACAPYAADPVANLGSALMKMGRTAEAMTSFKHALKLQPLYPKALALLANMEIDDDQLEAAAPRVRVLYDNDPSSPGSRRLVVKLQLKRAIAAVQQEDVSGVERACRDGLALVSDSSELTGFLGAYYVQLGRLPEAVNALEASHRLHPEDPRVTMSLGEVYARISRFAEARRLLREASSEAQKIGATSIQERCDELLRSLPEA